MITNDIKIATEINSHAEALIEWRKDAGAKSNWSFHEKIQEEKLYRSLESSVKLLEAEMALLIPAH